MEYAEIEKLAYERAEEIAGVTDLKFKISNQLKRWHALCYWREYPQAIHLNKTFIDLNIDNDKVIDELIIHECIHLIPGCSKHNKKFNRIGKKYGIRLYGYSTKFKSLKPLFATHCTKCDNYKTYYAKPHYKTCRLCNGELRLFDYRC